MNRNDIYKDTNQLMGMINCGLYYLLLLNVFGHVFHLVYFIRYLKRKKNIQNFFHFLYIFLFKWIQISIDIASSSMYFFLRITINHYNSHLKSY